MDRDSPTQAPASVYLRYFCAVVLVVLGALVYLWGHLKSMAQIEGLEALRAEQQTLLHEQDRLRVDIAGLKRSSRIREIASRKLGMAFPVAPPRNLYLEPAGPPVSGTKVPHAN